MRKICLSLIFFLCIFSHQICAQTISHFNVITGVFFYHYKPYTGESHGSKGSYSYNGGPSLGAGISVLPFSRILRLEYNMIYYSDKILVNNQYVIDGRTQIYDFTMQNQILCTVSDNSNSVNLRLGLCLDVVLHTRIDYSSGSQNGNKYIQVGDGSIRKYYQVSGLIGVSFGRQVKFAIDFISGLSGKIYSGDYDRIIAPTYFHGSPEAWYRRTMGSVSLIWQIPAIPNRE